MIDEIHTLVGAGGTGDGGGHTFNRSKTTSLRFCQFRLVKAPLTTTTVVEGRLLFSSRIGFRL